MLPIIRTPLRQTNCPFVAEMLEEASLDQAEQCIHLCNLLMVLVASLHGPRMELDPEVRRDEFPEPNLSATEARLPKSVSDDPRLYNIVQCYSRGP